MVQTKSPRVRPLVSYYGGKQRMAPKIVPLLPEHTVYVEPFAGGAAVLFAKPWPRTCNSDHYREVINDSCGLLINMYGAAKKFPHEFKRQLSLTLYSKEEHDNAKKLLSRAENKSNVDCDVDLAVAYFVNLQQSFANIPNAGWGTGVYGRNLAATWNSRETSVSANRLRSVHVDCDDAINIIRRWDSPQTLFYCDPPYVDADCAHYGNYSKKDFLELLKSLDDCDGSIVLSCYDVRDVSVPAGWQKLEFSSYCTASCLGKVGPTRSKHQQSKLTNAGKGRKRTEVVYRRFNKVPWRPELEKLRQAGVYDCFARNPKEGPHKPAAKSAKAAKASRVGTKQGKLL